MKVGFEVMMGRRRGWGVEMIDVVMVVVDMVVVVVKVGVEVVEVVGGFVEVRGVVMEVVVFVGKRMVDFVDVWMGESNVVMVKVKMVVGIEEGVKIEEFFVDVRNLCIIVEDMCE